MNLADDLISRDHREAEALLDRFDAKPHRSIAIELCDLLERHRAMEDEIVHPALREIDAGRVEESSEDHNRIDELVDQARHTSSRAELKDILSNLREALDEHVRREESDDLPAMEDALGVAAMNELGFRVGDFRRAWEREPDDVDELMELSREELYEKARAADVSGRSSMSKLELADALAG